VSAKETKNLPASIHRRLLNKARAEDRPFNELLQYFAIERFLYRLSKSKHANKFILKGALMVISWEASPSRPTADIDFLGLTKNEPANIEAVVRDVCTEAVVPDGIDFDVKSIQVETITDITEYQGLRVRLLARLGPARVPLQLDIGFGDPIVPGPETFDYPVLLDLPGPRLNGYSRESVVAEKLECIFRFGMLNSRLKDFYDIWLIINRFDFNGEELDAAIQATFSNRKRKVDTAAISQVQDYAGDKTRASQWVAFCRKNRLTPEPPDLARTVETIIKFIDPLIIAISSGENFRARWPAGGPWQL
jgi:predicted nucleotidyltransferase component of viral defense system